MEHSILVIDSNPVARKELCDRLHSHNYTPLSCATGKKALKKIKDTLVSVVISEINLSDGNGLALIPEIKRYSPWTECIIVTDAPSLKTSLNALDIGVFSYQQKPYDFTVLLNVIRKAIAEYEVNYILKRKNELYSFIIEQSDNIACIIDPSGTVLYVSPQIYQYGYNLEDIVSKSFFDFLASGNKYKTMQEFTHAIMKGECCEKVIHLGTRQVKAAYF